MIYKDKDEAIAAIMEKYGLKTKTEAEQKLRQEIPLEKVFQAKIIRAIRSRYPDAFVWKAGAGVYARQGIPDICAVICGHYFGFEVKRPYIGVISPIQQDSINRITKAGGTAAVVSYADEALEIIRRTLN